MQSTNTPPKILTPIAQQDGSRATVPLTTSDATRASQSAGFPDLTGLPPEAGGVPPQKPDMNGLLNLISGVPFWTAAGGRFGYDAAFATNAAINGYPRGALLASADLTGEWLSLNDNNTVNPDTVGTGWVPGTFYGQTLLANLTGGTVTLTPAQAAKPVLRITGTLAGNLIVELPAWIRDWTIYNGTSGAFTVSVRTPGRPSAVVPQTGAPIAVRGDGTDVSVTSVDVPPASTTVAGITRYATAQEAIQGSSQSLALTPFALTQAIPTASQTVEGRVRFATLTEFNNGATGPIVPSNRQVFDGLGAKQNNLGYTPANIVAPNFQGEVSATGGFTSTSGFFVGATTGINLGPSNSGPVRLRPNGASTGAGEMRVDPGAGNVFASGAVSAAGGFDTPSSRTVKDIEATFPYGLAEVLRVDPIHFRYTKAYRADDRLMLGFPAEDVRAVMPEAVRDTPGEVSPLALQSEQLVPVLWHAVQELAQEVRDLRERLGV